MLHFLQGYFFSMILLHREHAFLMKSFASITKGFVSEEEFEF
jgi:hypothetical protein